MERPDYLLCLDCETPCYTFEWTGSKVKEALCLACANDDPDTFVTEEDYDALMSSGH
ncbi:MAG: hypothetical protein AAGN46_13425 [Acidobacteriota bacterium]